MMSKDASNVVFELPSQWALLSEIRRHVMERLEAYDQDVRDAVAMVASELIENAIKYGEPVEALQTSQFRFSLSDDIVRMEVTNGLRSDSRYEALCARIKEINESENKMDPYVRRMQEIYNQPGASAGLGLFRIAVEGAFALECSWIHGVLTIIASRKLGLKHG